MTATDYKLRIRCIYIPYDDEIDKESEDDIEPIIEPEPEKDDWMIDCSQYFKNPKFTDLRYGRGDD